MKRIALLLLLLSVGCTPVADQPKKQETVKAEKKTEVTAPPVKKEKKSKLTLTVKDSKGNLLDGAVLDQIKWNGVLSDRAEHAYRGKWEVEFTGSIEFRVNWEQTVKIEATGEPIEKEIVLK